MKKKSIENYYPWDDDNYIPGIDDTTYVKSNKIEKELPDTDLPSVPVISAPKEFVKLTSAKQMESGDIISFREKVSDAIFEASPEVFLGETQLQVTEKEWRTIFPPADKPKTISKIVATVTIQLHINETANEHIKSVILTDRLNEFDRIVMETCVTHQYHGHTCISVSTIHKYLGGDGDPNTALRQDIWKSIDKLRHIDVVVDASEAYQNLKRLHLPNGQPKRNSAKPNSWIDEIEAENSKVKQVPKVRAILKGYLLPATDVLLSYHGLEFEGIKFLDVSPVFTYAKDKGETDIISQKLLQAAKRRATKNFIALKSYLLGRTRSMHRNQEKSNESLNSIITAGSVYQNCGDPEKAKTDSKFRTRLREAVVEYMNVLAEENEIAGFVLLNKCNQELKVTTKWVKIYVVLNSPKAKKKR